MPFTPFSTPGMGRRCPASFGHSAWPTAPGASSRWAARATRASCGMPWPSRWSMSLRKESRKNAGSPGSPGSPGNWRDMRKAIHVKMVKCCWQLQSDCIPIVYKWEKGSQPKVARVCYSCYTFSWWKALCYPAADVAKSVSTKLSSSGKKVSAMFQWNYQNLSVNLSDVHLRHFPEEPQHLANTLWGFGKVSYGGLQTAWYILGWVLNYVELCWQCNLPMLFQCKLPCCGGP